MESFSDFDSCPNCSFSLHVDMSLFQLQSIQMWWMFFIFFFWEAEKWKNWGGKRKITLNDNILKIISLSMMIRNGYEDIAYNKNHSQWTLFYIKLEIYAAVRRVLWKILIPLERLESFVIVDYFRLKWLKNIRCVFLYSITWRKEGETKEGWHKGGYRDIFFCLAHP